ncbi:MAG: Crp/Fnr family transcriptional regulator [Caldilineaceae bacterium]
MSDQATTAANLTEALQQLPFFEGLDAPLIQRFAQSAIRRVYEPGAIIFLEGDDSPGLYYVQSGWVKVVSMSAEGREQILHFLGAGEIFGGMTVFVRQPMPATAIALEPTALWLLPRDVVRQALLDVPLFALRVIEFMGERINDLVALVADLSLRSVTARLARQLLENAVDDVVQRQRWATQAEMAGRLGAAPDVVNRALRSLSDAGLIELSRQQIRILDREGLAAKALPDR